MVKVARGKGEDARVTIRNIRRKAMEELHRIVARRRGGRGRGRPRREGAPGHHRPLRAPGRRPGQAQGDRTPRGLSQTDHGPLREPREAAAGDRIPRRPRAGPAGPRPRRVAARRPAGRPSRAGRDLGSAIAVGLGLGAIILVPLLTVRQTFVGVLAAATAVATWELRDALRRGAGIEVPLPVLLVGGQAMIWLSWPFGLRGLALAVRRHGAGLPGVADARRCRALPARRLGRACSPPSTCRCSAPSSSC